MICQKNGPSDIKVNSKILYGGIFLTNFAIFINFFFCPWTEIFCFQNKSNFFLQNPPSELLCFWIKFSQNQNISLLAFKICQPQFKTFSAFQDCLKIVRPALLFNFHENLVKSAKINTFAVLSYKNLHSSKSSKNSKPLCATKALTGNSLLQQNQCPHDFVWKG